jgi:hypothetical protein
LPILHEPHARHPGSLGRRELIQWLGAAAAARSLPACTEAGTRLPAPKTTPPVLLTTQQQSALAAFADYFVPPDDLPGGAQLGVVAYVDALLTALDGEAPLIFAGGPYSGRWPFATSDGQVGDVYPADGFKTFVPLDRYREAAWKLRLFGSAATPGGGINDAVIGVTLGLRNQIPQALDAAIASITVPLDTGTSAAQVEEAWLSLPSVDREALSELIFEGCFSSPEYGGNADYAGFHMCHFGGDVQPLGHTLYDEATGSYNEFIGTPVTSLDPGPDPDPLDAATQALIKTLVMFAGGEVYY